MKRIYLFLTMAVAVLLTGCSDDVVGPEIPSQPENEGLFFSIGVSDGMKTKADTPLVGEDKINDLTVFLFDSGDGSRVKKETVLNSDYIADVELDKGGTFDIILIANAGATALSNVSSRDELNNVLIDITDQKQTNLLMVSKLFEKVTVDHLTNGNVGSSRRTYCYLKEEDGNNTINSYSERQKIEELYGAGNGKIAPVIITRLASRIQLESVRIDFAEKNLEGAIFRLDSVYLVNARPLTLLVPVDGKYENKTGGYYRGAPKKFDVIYSMIAPGATVKEEIYLKTYAGRHAVYIKDGQQKQFSNGTVLATDIFKCYAFENHAVYVYNKDKTDYDTRLVIVGEIILPGNNTGLGTSYFHIPIKKGDEFQLVRNNIYRVHVVIKSYGYNRPDGNVDTSDPNDPEKPIIPPVDPNKPGEPGDPTLNNSQFIVIVKVDPWKVINQYEED